MDIEILWRERGGKIEREEDNRWIKENEAGRKGPRQIKTGGRMWLGE